MFHPLGILSDLRQINNSVRIRLYIFYYSIKVKQAIEGLPISYLVQFINIQNVFIFKQFANCSLLYDRMLQLNLQYVTKLIC